LGDAVDWKNPKGGLQLIKKLRSHSSSGRKRSSKNGAPRIKARDRRGGRNARSFGDESLPSTSLGNHKKGGLRVFRSKGVEVLGRGKSGF